MSTYNINTIKRIWSENSLDGVSPVAVSLRCKDIMKVSHNDIPWHFICETLNNLVKEGYNPQHCYSVDYSTPATVLASWG